MQTLPGCRPPGGRPGHVLCDAGWEANYPFRQKQWHLPVKTLPCPKTLFSGGNNAFQSVKKFECVQELRGGWILAQWGPNSTSLNIPSRDGVLYDWKHSKTSRFHFVQMNLWLWRNQLIKFSMFVCFHIIHYSTKWDGLWLTVSVELYLWISITMRGALAYVASDRIFTKK